MHSYIIVLSKRAEKQLDKIDNKTVEPILNAISSLATNPRPIGYKKLKGRNALRIRVGNYRVIYNIFDAELIIDIINVGHRKNVYE